MKTRGPPIQSIKIVYQSPAPRPTTFCPRRAILMGYQWTQTVCLVSFSTNPSNLGGSWRLVFFSCNLSKIISTDSNFPKHYFDNVFTTQFFNISNFRLFFGDKELRDLQKIGDIVGCELVDLCFLRRDPEQAKWLEAATDLSWDVEHGIWDHILAKQLMEEFLKESNLRCECIKFQILRNYSKLMWNWA